MKQPTWRPLSLRRMLLLIIGVMTLLAVAISASEFYATARRVAEIKHLRLATDFTNQMFLASESLALERDVALSLLSSRAPSDAAILPDLSRARDDADSALRMALATLDTDNSVAAAHWRTRISAHTTELHTLRDTIDHELQQRSPQADLVGVRWRTTVGTLLSDIDALWADTIRRYVNIDPVITQYLRYNHFLRLIFDYSGRERALISQLVAANARATPAQAAELFRGDGVLQTSWQMSFVLATQSGLYPAIETEYLDAKSHYDLLHAMLEQTFYTPGAQDAARFPLTLPLWFELSQQARDSLLVLRQASRAAMRARVDTLIASGERAMLLQGAILMLALCLCALNVWAVLTRVIKPIDQIIAALVKAIRGEPVTFSRHRNSDEIGQLVHVLNAFQTKVEDVRRSAADLDCSERRLRAVVDNAADGLITMDARGAIHAFNPACERLFRYSAGEIFGANVSCLMAAEDAENGWLAGEQGGASETPPSVTSVCELLARRKDGSVFPIELSISAFELPEGKYFSAIIRDITQRKEEEATLLAHTRALERSNKELDDFAYIASHDLKEPLRGIHNHARFLMEDNADKLDDESVRRVHRLLYLSQRMEQLVNDLLYFSRLGRHDLAIQRTDIADVVKDIETTLEHFLSENGAALSIKGALPVIHCDKTRITEAMRNLVTNAVKYNDKSEKTIEVGVAAFKSAPDGDIVERAFYVADNGCGIAPEFHEEVFRIFKRLQGPSSEKDGTGVGLTFVKKIIERHGGRIWVESTPGAGATFYFTLETPDDHANDSRAAA